MYTEPKLGVQNGDPVSIHPDEDKEQLMTLHSTEKATGTTRRQAVKATRKALGGLAGLAALPSLSGNAVEAPPQTIPASQLNQDKSSKKTKPEFPFWTSMSHSR
jgi:hypothetical protein